MSVVVCCCLFVLPFEQTARGWYHQLQAAGAAGFHAVAFDQRGYGASEFPGAAKYLDKYLRHLFASQGVDTVNDTRPVWQVIRSQSMRSTLRAPTTGLDTFMRSVARHVCGG